MAYANAAITEFKDGSTPLLGTLALGSLFEAEFDQLYGNWNHFFGAAGTTLTVDNITEKVVDAGVTIEGSLLKDNNIDSSGIITVDTINEHTSDAGVTIEGSLLKDTKIAVGISAVKGAAGVVHIANGTNADTNWHNDCPLVVENNASCYINIRTPNNTYGGLTFSDPDAIYAGRIIYYHTSDYMMFYTAASERMRLNATGLYIGGAANPTKMLDVNGDGYIRGTTESTSKDTGALIVEGGVGIEKSICAGLGRVPAGSYEASAQTQDNVFDALSVAVPNTGDIKILTGGFYDGSTYVRIVNRVERVNATNLAVYYMRDDGTVSNTNFTDGTGTGSWNFSVSW